MSRWSRAAAIVTVTVAGAGVLAVRRWQRRAAEDRESGPGSRWRAVTIFCRPEEVMPGGQAPTPLAALGELEVEVRPAPGGRGTELRARLRRPEPSGVRGAVSRLTGNDPRQRVRLALREAKQLIEVGEVLRVDPAPHGARPKTPIGKLIEFATKRAPGESVL
jgi:hypothetical protein